ncbi:ATP-dependent protease [Ferrimonas sediminicola]|uniref:ATP-dependent protease n=1 Tax=Ferrimonas sediminicola TaxID=2569538 RepID=A0A4U1BI86_9GAMM|nr:YifB family Mg chelatase-like AAA ATPase [Ferrimonas sediminicola]TKB51033.1 ATP-dependent protease [Ferrimonas sediminicola]
MALAQVLTRGQLGMDAPEIRVEVHLGGGLPSFTLVGLPEASVRESRERVRAALSSGGFQFPARRITVNLAPAELPKQGGRFDLAIALGILCASGQLPQTCADNREFFGELSLSGEIMPCAGLLPSALAAKRARHQMVVPERGSDELQLVPGLDAVTAPTLPLLIASLLGQRTFTRVTPSSVRQPDADSDRDLGEVIGQQQGKLALMIAAAGGHNLLLMGPPGTGKTMLASRLCDLLPPLEVDAALEVAAIHSVAGLPRAPSRLLQRPFRAPHHSSSAASLVGGGSQPKPGEISLAHHGVLFLDELPEFPRSVLDSLREPLESGEVVISRAAAKLTYPARFQLIAAMNPSPCGDTGPHSRSTPEQIRRYLGRLSGPFLDRFDLTVEVARLAPGELTRQPLQGVTTEQARARVIAARTRALSRQGTLNARLPASALAGEVGIVPEAAAFAEQGLNRLGLSIRAYHRILRVSRTLADLEGGGTVTRAHVAQAFGFRAMDKLMARLRPL